MIRGKPKGYPAWNKGLTKADPRVLKYILPKFGKKRPDIAGKNNWRWIEDRTKIKGYWLERNNPEYKQWRKMVYRRDNFKCKIGNQECLGKIEAHHILNFQDYPELRYEINNGITLCHFHHPRKRIEEKQLSPYFKSLLTNKN